MLSTIILFISQFDLPIVLMSESVSTNYSLLVELSIPRFALAIAPLLDPFELSIPRPALLVLLSISIPTRILSLLFNI